MDAPVFSGCVKNKLANPEIIEPIANYVDSLYKYHEGANGIHINLLGNIGPANQPPPSKKVVCRKARR